MFPRIQSLKQIQPGLAFLAANLDSDASLEALSSRVGLSPFHVHRLFSAAAGETPKRFTLRLRLSRAAVMLLTRSDSVLDIALSCGFQSHEVFTRAFRRRFGLSPSAYRVRGFAQPVGSSTKQMHEDTVKQVGPCVKFYHIAEFKRTPMTYVVEKRKLSPQSVLLVQRRVARSEIAAAITEVLPKIFEYAQKNGIALSGHPLTRYVEIGPGLLTIEPAMRIATGAEFRGEGEVRAETLPGGPAAVTTHSGSYENLHEAYAAIERWIGEQGLSAAGAPWESYVTDPAEFPDPKDWKTEVFWPLASY